MIINRYIVRNILLGTLGAALVLLSLALFSIFVGELDNLGTGDYGLLQVIQFIALRAPGKLVEFLPLAVLLGSILSLGALASNSEIIAMQASGLSLARLMGAVMQAALLIVVLSFLLAQWLVPLSETSARQLKYSKQTQTTALRANQGLWIKDDTRVLQIASLLPNGIARDIEIFQFDANGKLYSITHAESAIPKGNGWELHQVEQSIIGDDFVRAQNYDQLIYEGNLSNELLDVLLREPRQMSIFELNSYIGFLQENQLSVNVERLLFWQNVFAPLTIVVMCLMALPFVLGAQRQANSGQRLLMGILLGLAFVVVKKLLIQLGVWFEFNALLVALSPNLVFLGLAFYYAQALGSSLKWISVSSVLVYIAFFAISLGPIAWLIISEIYPLKIRGLGMSIATFSNWLFNFIVAKTFLTLTHALTIPGTEIKDVHGALGPNPAGAFWVFAFIGILGVLFTYFYLPETKGHTLEEIEEHWVKGGKPRGLK
jgi:lipopolysaccharide export system permease protein